MKKRLLNLVKSEHYEVRPNGSRSAYAGSVFSRRSTNDKFKNTSSSVLKLKLNSKTPDIETVEVMNKSPYLQRLEMLWGDSAEFL